MGQDTAEQRTCSIELSDAAVSKVAELLETEEPGLALRVSVEPGGCSGMRYQLFFTDQYAKVFAKDLAEHGDQAFMETDDEETATQRVALEREKESVVWFDRFAVVVDRKSAPYLSGAAIDYVDTLQKSSFTIDNPNAAGSCGCGDSFS